MTRPEPRGAELRGLTGLRGIAAWFVVLYHLRTACAPSLHPAALAIVGKGYLAVDLFFVLSGFVIWLSYGERLRADGPGGVPRFLLRRVARIWPLHAFILAGAVLLAAALAATGRPPGSFVWHELPLHILLVQNWGFTPALAWNDPAWSISCELAAYLLFPLLVAAVRWERLPPPALLAAAAAFLVLLHAVFAGHGLRVLGADITHLGLVRCLAEFATGTIACALWKRWHDRDGIGFAALVAAALLLTVWWSGRAPETLVVPAAFAALILGLAILDRRSPLRAAPLHYLGEVSYATYLVHYLLFYAFKLVAVRDAADMPLWQGALFLALTLAASIALYHGVERPAQRAINRLGGSARGFATARV